MPSSLVSKSFEGIGRETKHNAVAEETYREISRMQDDDVDSVGDVEGDDAVEKTLFAKAPGGQDWHRPEWVNKLLEKMLNYTSDFVINATPDEDTETWIRGPKAYVVAYQFNK